MSYGPNESHEPDEVPEQTSTEAGRMILIIVRGEAGLNRHGERGAAYAVVATTHGSATVEEARIVFERYKRLDPEELPDATANDAECEGIVSALSNLHSANWRHWRFRIMCRSVFVSELLSGRSSTNVKRFLAYRERILQLLRDLEATAVDVPSMPKSPKPEEPR